MDIGTAKPTPAERAGAPHHLIDIRDPAQAYSAAEFARDAGPLIHEIRSRGALPLLVGGTMLYFKALFDGLSAMPAADAAVRAGIDEEATREGWPALHAELARVDPATASRLAPNDSQRIQRALEVFRVSGRPLSEWHATDAAQGGMTPALLLSLAAVVALNVWLFTLIPKGFFPQDDTGLIYGGTQASTEISFKAMSDLQQKVEAILRGEAVTLSGRVLRASEKEVFVRLFAHGAARLPGVIGEATLRPRRGGPAT